MWRVIMFLICLIATLAGTPLRQAEAASDFARGVADLDEGPDIDEIDGGVGDDSGVAILKIGSDTQTPQAIIAPASTGIFQPLLETISSIGLSRRHAIYRAEPLATSAVRKHVWLGCFLI